MRAGEIHAGSVVDIKGFTRENIIIGVQSTWHKYFHPPGWSLQCQVLHRDA